MIIKCINGLFVVGKEVGLYIDELLNIDICGFIMEEVSL